ncbi:stage III sporulation protein AF [Anaeromicropila populeti]|uniref:Stage III sporulation protein AF n=1 Tax=Anaeromicropila populeti TaxID=37658 RepID=A0A1I6ILH1_9FIRM|nr:stage III sporulation protein AF [Anaeromicropila populeti]SFR67566.1 stage III sporulation protein AF [Anaeromicropila populeti]
MEIIKELVRNILIYFVLVTIATNLIGNNSYKKYIKTFTGFVLILIILNPLIQLLKMEDLLDFNLKKYQLFETSSYMGNGIEIAELNQREMILEEYKKNIQEQIKIILENYEYAPVDVTVEIEEDQGNEKYGSIKKIQAVITNQVSAEEALKQEESSVTDRIFIEPVEIPAINGTDDKSLAEEVQCSFDTKEMKREIANVYGVSKEQIVIEIFKEE